MNMASFSTGHGRRRFFQQLAALGGAAAVPSGLSCSRGAEQASAETPRTPASLEAPLRIDGHQHFWTYTPENYSWIDPKSAVARDFAPSDLQPELARAGIQGTILVEARSAAAETEHLLGIAAQASFVRGVVGWLPLAEPSVAGLIEQYAADPKLRGLRHAIAAEADPEFMLREDFNRGIALLAARGLRFDLLLVPDNLSRACRLVDRHPKQIFVLDHFAKPQIKAHQLEPWRSDFIELSRRPNVYCKVSGLVNEADQQHWQPSDLQPYLDVALQAFTPQRLLFGSDWPMCLLATTYDRWFSTVQQWLAQLSPSEQGRILGETAVEAYGLPPG
jgi:L-fuconolactonase